MCSTSAQYALSHYAQYAHPAYAAASAYAPAYASPYGSPYAAAAPAAAYAGYNPYAAYHGW